MAWLSHFDAGKLVLLTLVLTRVSGLMMTAPLFGAREVPMQVRGLLSFALSLLILPTQWDVSITWPGTLLNYLVYVAGELAIGLSLGLGIQLLLSGIQLAGQLIGRIGGEAMAEVYDPTFDESTPVLSQLLFQVTLTVFLVIGGHRTVLAALLDTFQSLPLGGCTLPQEVPETMITLLSQCFSLAVRAGAPVATALLVATIVLGLIGRTIPQLNIMALGFGVNSIVMPAVLMLSLGAATWIFQEQLEPFVQTLLEALHG